MKLCDSANFLSNAILAAMIVSMKSLSLYHLKMGWELSWISSLSANGTRFARDTPAGWAARYIFMQLLNATLQVVVANELVSRWSGYSRHTKDHCYRALPTYHISNSEDARGFVTDTWISLAFTLTGLPSIADFGWVLVKIRRLDGELNMKSRKWFLGRRFGSCLLELWGRVGMCIMQNYWAGNSLADIVSMFILNKPLLGSGDDEIKWGFGQVMAMLMLLNPVYVILLGCIGMYIFLKQCCSLSPVYNTVSWHFQDPFSFSD